MKMILLLMPLVTLVGAETVTAQTPDVQLLDFTASYCQPCQQMVPILQSMERDKFPVRQIDITEEHELAKKFNVNNIPTFVLMVEGKEVKRFVGLTDEAELRSEMNRAARRLAESRGSNPPEASKFRPVTAKTTQEIRTAEGDTSEASKGAVSSVKDIFRGLLGAGGKSNAFEYPTLRGQSPEETESPLNGLEAASAATVRVRVGGVSTKDGNKIQDVGTGTIVYSAPGQAIILTCAHVFLDLSTKEAVIEVEVFENGKPVAYPATLIGGDHNSDLAFLKLKTSKAMPVVRLTESAPKVVKGQPLVSFGCNGGSDPTSLETKIVDINRYNGPGNLVCSTDPKSGRSGGGLFNANGELVGVCSCADRKLHEGLYMAHSSIQGLTKQLNLQAILTRLPGSGGEDAASSFADLLEGKSGEKEGPAVPIETPSEEIAKAEPPTFDESVDAVEKVETSTDVAWSDDSEAGELSDAPLFNPQATKPTLARSADAVAAAISGNGPEITILIDDKRPGSQKKVIVIPQATPWMMELLTGETGEVRSAASARTAGTETASTSTRKSIKPVRRIARTTAVSQSP